MGNPNTEKKKAQKRKVRAREMQKTRIYTHFGWNDLTPYASEEVLFTCRFA